MAVIRASAEVGAPLEAVWGVVSDLDAEPRFWKGTLAVRNLSREGNVVRREVTLAFRGRRCEQEVTLRPMEEVAAVFTGGIIRGTKTVRLSPAGGRTGVEAVWDIRLSGPMGAFTGMLRGHVLRGTEQALRAIKEEAEGRARGAGG